MIDYLCFGLNVEDLRIEEELCPARWVSTSTRSRRVGCCYNIIMMFHVVL